MDNNTNEVPIGLIVTNPEQPRKTFEAKSLDGLKASFKRAGQLQPISIRPIGNDRFMIAAGERRFRAATELGWSKIKAVLLDEKTCRDLDAGKISIEELALIENLHREDLTPLEEAECYHAMLEQHGYTQKALAKHISKSPSYVNEKLKLLELPAKVQDYLRSGDLSFSHAKVLQQLPVEDQEQLAADAVESDSSVRETKKSADAKRKGRCGKAPNPDKLVARAKSLVRQARTRLDEGLKHLADVADHYEEHDQFTLADAVEHLEQADRILKGFLKE